MQILETDRLVLRHLTLDDASFVFELVNDPAWLQYIGDRGVRSLDDARNYIAKGPVAMYERVGYGLFLTALKNAQPIGICGLLKRDTLDDVDLGFAFLPAYRGAGYATEASAAVLDYGRRVLGLARVVAITSIDNDASGRVLEKVGFTFEKTIDVSGETLKLYGRDL